MSRCRPVLPILALLALLAGCAAPRTRDAGVHGPTGHALPFTLIAAAPVNALEPLDPDETRYPHRNLESDVAGLERSVLRALRQEGVFETVSRLEQVEDGGETLGTAARQAADFLLETRVKRRVVSYVERNGWFIPNLGLCVLAFPLAWLVPDEVYALELEVEATLRSWSSGVVIHSDVHHVRVEESLDDFERGWEFLGLLQVPGTLDEENWEKVDEALAPGAERKIAHDLAHHIAQEIRVGIHSPSFTKAFASRYALVVGVSQFQDPAVHRLRFADADARRFHGHITGPGRVPAHNTILLLNDKAKREDIRRALERFVTLGASGDDEIVIYFAGYGAWQRGRGYVLPHDADSERLKKTALSLDELAAPARRRGGPRITLVLDTPFVSRFRGRGASEETIDAGPEVFGAFLEDSRHQVLASSRVGQPCLELEDVGGGLFTYYLVRGLEGKADGNRDGRVTWEEAAAHARWMVEVHAPIEGKLQEPGYFRKGLASRD